jgi:hypothetical protein
MSATLAVIAAIYGIRSTVQKRQQEKYRAKELVDVVLKRLQDQASASVVPADPAGETTLF